MQRTDVNSDIREEDDPMDLEEWCKGWKNSDYFRSSLPVPGQPAPSQPVPIPVPSQPASSQPLPSVSLPNQPAPRQPAFGLFAQTPSKPDSPVSSKRSDSSKSSSPSAPDDEKYVRLEEGISTPRQGDQALA